MISGLRVFDTTINPTTEWQKLSVTAVLPSDWLNISQNLDLCFVKTDWDGIRYMRNVMLEKGSVTSSPRPCISDLQKKVITPNWVIEEIDEELVFKSGTTIGRFAKLVFVNLLTFD